MTYKLLKNSEEWRPNEVMFQTEPGAKGSGASEPMYYVPHPEISFLERLINFSRNLPVDA
ncbi:hypothetical protein ACTXT7_003599 [Hymenolepis weldensis]